MIAEKGAEMIRGAARATQPEIDVKAAQPKGYQLGGTVRRVGITKRPAIHSMSGSCRGRRAVRWPQPGRQIFGALIEEIRFAPDSSLEGDGFKLSVPLAKERRFWPLITRNSLTTTPSAFHIGGNSIRSQGIT